MPGKHNSECDVPKRRPNTQKVPRNLSDDSDFPKHLHRNSQKRIYGEYVYFITCDIDKKIEFFADPIFCELWIAELKLCKEYMKFKLITFCLNYDHFHLIIKPDNKIANYSEIMHFIKRNYTKDANKILGFINIDHEYDNAEGDDTNRSQFDDRDQCDDWDRRLQTHKKYLWDLRIKFKTKHATNHDFPKFKWQKSFYDHIIRDDKDLENHWNYTTYNFLKHDLPEDWQYTSLNYPELIDNID